MPIALEKNPKGRQVLHFLSKKNPDFIFVIDTRICPTIENVIIEKESKCQDTISGISNKAGIEDITKVNIIKNENSIAE